MIGDHQHAHDTALALKDGILVKSGMPTRLYIGTLRTTAAATTEDSNAKRFLWNMYNRVLKGSKQSDSTGAGSCNTTNTTYAALCSAAGQLHQFVIGDLLTATHKLNATPGYHYFQVINKSNAATVVQWEMLDQSGISTSTMR